MEKRRVRTKWSKVNWFTEDTNPRRAEKRGSGGVLDPSVAADQRRFRRNSSLVAPRFANSKPSQEELPDGYTKIR